MARTSNIRLANPMVTPALRALSPGSYAINEIYQSVQGEGINAGIPMVFVRFAECNLRCAVKNAGFDCDTEFSSFTSLTLQQLQDEAALFKESCAWVLLTGGEPGLQINEELVGKFKELGFKVAIESNGTIKLPKNIDWITISPKSAEHTLRQRKANEVKYVRAHGMGLPQPEIQADHHLISPAFQPDGSLLRQDFDWCLKLLAQEPAKWRLSVQIHKLLNIR